MKVWSCSVVVLFFLALTPAIGQAEDGFYVIPVPKAVSGGAGFLDHQTLASDVTTTETPASTPVFDAVFTHTFTLHFVQSVFIVVDMALTHAALSTAGIAYRVDGGAVKSIEVRSEGGTGRFMRCVVIADLGSGPHTVEVGTLNDFSHLTVLANAPEYYTYSGAPCSSSTLIRADQVSP